LAELLVAARRAVLPHPVVERRGDALPRLANVLSLENDEQLLWAVMRRMVIRRLAAKRGRIESSSEAAVIILLHHADGALQNLS
jgi:hypothetical protein